MIPVIGVDGCPGGWIAVIWDKILEHRLCATFDDVLRLNGKVIAVDMPIGFETTARTGGRQAEKQARRILGKKGSSVFPSPARIVVEENPRDYDRARQLNRENSAPPKAITIFAYGILRKMHEIDMAMTPMLQDRVFETHPEICFHLLNGEIPLSHSKKSGRRPNEEGLALRRDLLAKAGFPIAALPALTYLKKHVAVDDLIDACACAWVARRILNGEAQRFPADPPRDARGLRMEINA